jgi:predicted metal-dependent hydrolase
MESIGIVRRQIAIDFEPVPPGPWSREWQVIEEVVNGFSLGIPAGERFFIASVWAYQDRLVDPRLAEQVRGFVHQEAMHNKIHIDCNAMLVRHHPRYRVVERLSERVFSGLGHLPRWFRLSITVAMEHFTAMTADTLFREEVHVRRMLPAEVVELWLWHAVEETEHKAVAFDVHRAVVGSGPIGYLNRIAGMVAGSLIFLFLFVVGALRLGWHRRTPAGPAAPAEAAVPPPVESPPAKRPSLALSILPVLRNLIPWRLYFSYYRPSFHPWDHDNAHFVADWKKRYPDFGLAKASR